MLSASAILYCRPSVRPSVCLHLQYFSTSSYKRHDFRKEKITEHKMCLIFSTTFVWNVSILLWIQRDIIINARKSSCKVAVTHYCQMLMHPEFSRQIFEKYSNIKFHKNPPPPHWKPTCSMQTDGQTDMTKLNSRFSQFCETRLIKCTWFSLEFRTALFPVIIQFSIYILCIFFPFSCTSWVLSTRRPTTGVSSLYTERPWGPTDVIDVVALHYNVEEGICHYRALVFTAVITRWL